MIETDVLVIGGGIAGLSTARSLRALDGGRTRCLVVEKEDKVGGRAATEKKDGFLFDHTGHLLHLHDPYAKRELLRLLGGNVASHDRSSWIYSHKTMTRYPFQANTYGLPPAVVADCVAGFMKNVHRPPKLSRDPSFEEWCLKTFGDGISRNFMIPYNEKLWRTPLSKMTTEWLGRFLPRPRPEEVLYGALVDQKRFFGYNAHFRYPKRGGIQALPDALAAGLPDIRLGRRVLSIDLRQKIAVIIGLGEVRYKKLVNTMPLNEFLDAAGPLPPAIRAARKKLRWVSVYNLNIGIARAAISDKHWCYFPEKRFPFYRAGFMSNFAADLAPRGTTGMYIEVSARPGERVDLDRLERLCLQGLRSAGILRSSDKLATRLWIPIPCAYVIYDRSRTPALDAIFPFLKKNGVESIGRWGGWKYSFMEETFLDGKRCAERLLGLKGPGRSETMDAPLEALK